jgi:glutaminase
MAVTVLSAGRAWIRPVIRSPVLDVLERVVETCRGLTDGTVADYIPELAKADPEWFGAALASTDGHVYEVGDTRQEFTIQSVSKPFAYGGALDALGSAAVTERVGVEPSGNAFNAIMVDEVSHRPFNPMVNAGAIVTTGMLPGDGVDDLGAPVVDLLGRYAGRRLSIDVETFESERATGDRNRAIAYLMRSLGMLDDVESTLDSYFRQCSVLVTCHDLALMAATLANGGRNPVTGARALDEKNVERVLSVMSTCGMYDYAGEWAYAVGLPAKSGVSGGVIAVLPGQLGIGVFSPRLDARGNSRRGIAVCEALSEAFGLHANRAWPRAGSAVRRRYRGDEVRSSRVRTTAEQAVLDENGGAVAIFELHGDLLFASAEPICRTVADALDGVQVVVLDFRRVRAIDKPAIRLLEGLVAELQAVGRSVIVTHLDPTAAHAQIEGIEGVRSFDDTETAMGVCEDELLAMHGATAAGERALRDQELLRGLPLEAVMTLDEVAESASYEAGELIVCEGDPADAVYFLAEGEVSVRLPLDGTARTRRLATFGPGVAFGEAALLDETVRTADVRAESSARVSVLAVATLDDVEGHHPGTRATILTNLANVLVRRVQTANAHIRALER